MNALTAARLDTDNDIRFFNFNDKEVRMLIFNNNPWFVAKDVCDILDLKNPTESLRNLDEDEKNTLRISEGIRGNPDKIVINESGLYALILRSNKPQAKAFRKWVTSEVLPSIRKNGMYAKDELLDNPDLLLEIITKLKEERERNKELKRDNEEYKTQLEYSKEWYSIKRVAKKNEVSHKTFNWRKLKDCNHFFGVIYEEYQESKLELKKIKKQMKFVFDFTHKGETGTPFLACLLKLREMALSAACELIQLAVVCQRGIDCFLDKEKEDKK